MSETDRFRFVRFYNGTIPVFEDTVTGKFYSGIQGQTPYYARGKLMYYSDLMICEFSAHPDSVSYYNHPCAVDITKALRPLMQAVLLAD